MGHLAKKSDGRLTRHPDTGHLIKCVFRCSECPGCASLTNNLKATLSELNDNLCLGTCFETGMETAKLKSLTIDGVHTLTLFEPCWWVNFNIGVLEFEWYPSLDCSGSPTSTSQHTVGIDVTYSESCETTVGIYSDNDALQSAIFTYNTLVQACGPVGSYGNQNDSCGVLSLYPNGPYVPGGFGIVTLEEI